MIASSRNGKNAGPGEAAHDRDAECQHEDDRLGDQEDLDVQQEGMGDLAESRR